MASGYLKVLSHERLEKITAGRYPKYELALTNLEVRCMFFSMVQDLFYAVEDDYNDFIKFLLIGDKKAMNAYMNRVMLQTSTCNL